MANLIKFLKTNQDISEEYYPEPSKNNIPSWYKETKPYSSDNKYGYGSVKNSTIKKCMPVFDAMSSGYVIKLHSDIYVKYNGVGYEFKPALDSINIIDFHPKKQVENYPFNKEMYSLLPKITNPWGIKTKSGYSSLIIPPMHRENIIGILPGVVDTDKYNAPVNLPFVINKDRYTGIVKAGTPIAQVIPFKRDTWSMLIEEDLEVDKKTATKILSVFYNGYKDMFWNKKEFN